MFTGMISIFEEKLKKQKRKVKKALKEHREGKVDKETIIALLKEINSLKKTVNKAKKVEGVQKTQVIEDFEVYVCPHCDGEVRVARSPTIVITEESEV